MKNQNKIIFIVGSKPEAIFPSVVPDEIYAANGAIARVQKYMSSSRVYGVVSNSIFCDLNEHTEHALKQLYGSNVEKLFIINFRKKTEEKINPESVLFLTNKFRISRWKKSYYEIKLLGMFFSLKYIIGNNRISDILRGLYYFTQRQLIFFCKPSTGLVAFSLLDQENRHCSLEVYIIGIGFDAKSSHFYDSNLIYGDGHIVSDLLFLSRVIKNRSNWKIKITDMQAKFNFKAYLNQL